MPSDSARAARGAGIAPLLGAVAGLVVWAVHFAAIYGANAVVCARGLAGRTLLGLPIAQALVLGATVVALAAVAMLGLRAWRRLQGDARFAGRMAVGTALLAALAILWEAVPALILQPCG